MGSKDKLKQSIDSMLLTELYDSKRMEIGKAMLVVNERFKAVCGRNMTDDEFFDSVVRNKGEGKLVHEREGWRTYISITHYGMAASYERAPSRLF